MFLSSTKTCVKPKTENDLFKTMVKTRITIKQQNQLKDNLESE